uniref:Uncharacterized protein n=1 Tax=Solanum lycopersicum TaxID=4081 RepID=A0A3Q7JJA1_SOLLC
MDIKLCYMDFLTGTYSVWVDCEDEEDDRTTPETQLIKLLLAKSRVLLRILIDTRYLPDKPLDTRSKIFAKVHCGDEE